MAQEGVIRPCPIHPDVLVYRPDSGRENSSFNLACIWIKERVGHFDRGDVRDSMRAAKESAAIDECSECARVRKS
jgi:hypothetical protein